MTPPVLRLSRTSAIGKRCILGKLIDVQMGHLRAVTLELPYNRNQPFRSCIPAGVYTVKQFDSPHLGKCFAFDDEEVSPRSAIRIHSGNVAKDIEGCAIVGTHYGLLNGEVAVLASRDAMKALLNDFPAGFIVHIDESGLA